MLAVVIPARNEAARIQSVLRQVLRLPVGLVIPVVNGTQDMTLAVVRRSGDKRVQPLLFREALGYDVPRVAGARQALEQGAKGVLFVDADLGGPVFGTLLSLIHHLRANGMDLVLTDCYVDTPVPQRESRAMTVYQTRLRLNQALGRPDLGPAIPSHGPCGVSRRLLESIPLASVGVPPLMQAYAILAGMKVAVGASIPHKELGSVRRDREHREKIAETIIGDCLQAICLAEGRPVDREGHLGYHPERRFDLLGLDYPSPDGRKLSADEVVG